MFKGEKMQKKNIRKISTALLMSVVLSVGNVSFADKIKDLRKEQDGIKEELRVTQKKIKETQTETKDTSAQIEELDRKMNIASIELVKVENELDSIQKAIEKNLKELKAAEKKLAEKQEQFDARVKVMYMNGNVGYLELLLTSKDIKDFFTRKDMVQAIAKQDKELLQEMKEQKEIIEEKKLELETQRASLSTAKIKLESRKKDLKAATREKEELMARLQKDLAEFEREYDKLNDFAAGIEGKILRLQEEQRARELAQQVNRNPGSTGSSSGGSSVSYTGGRMAWPVPSSGSISSYFGYRIHPIFNTKKLHTGIDIPASSGSNVIAASAGTVIYNGWFGGYGNTVMVDHGGGIVTLYAHNSTVVVGVGQSVGKGTVIAKIGSTGNSTGPHCHFEVRQNGKYIDPLPWVRGN